MYPKVIIYDIDPVIDLLRETNIEGLTKKEFLKFSRLWCMEQLREFHIAHLSCNLQYIAKRSTEEYHSAFLAIHPAIIKLFYAMVRVPRELYHLEVKDIKVRVGSLYMFY